MNLIFLSGGSGKRLWPLSNNARSKQFLPLLEGPDGQPESMIQRVVRQTREAGIDADITFATNAAQRDSIINQLGDNVGIVVEPEPRDTFPAVALACAHLRFNRHCSDDEVIVVLPCDTYTDNTYFETIKRLAQSAQPTQLSPFPSGEGRGVASFPLSYMLSLLRRYIPADDFDTVYRHYSDLPNVSFFQQMLDQDASVAVVPFNGKWKELGSWNALTEELHHHAMGNVVLGDEMTNTHVINELEIPVFCNGLRDLVVACSPDGVLVCHKDHTEDIQHYVDQLNLRPMYEERRWGTYKVLSDVAYQDGSRSLTKTIHLIPDKFISYQIHHHRDEVWTIVDGQGLFVLDGVRRNVQRGDVLVIRKEQWHAIRAVTPLTFIEVQLGAPLIEEDIERTEYNWL